MSPSDLWHDLNYRTQVQRDEHPLLSRLVVLRVALNHEFGHAFREFDHELAQIEIALVGALTAKPDPERLARIRATLFPTQPSRCAEPIDIEDARWLLVLVEKATPDLGGEEFYNLMQAYRHAPQTDPAAVIAAFEAVKAHIFGIATPA